MAHKDRPPPYVPPPAPNRPFKFITDWFTTTPTPTSAPPGWGAGHYDYSQGPPSQRMFGGSSIYGGAHGSRLPAERDRYTSYEQPSIWDKIKDTAKRADWGSLANLAIDDPQPGVPGPKLSTPGRPASRRGFRQIPYYQPPMPMSMDVAALIQLIQQAQKSRGTPIRRFNINPIV